MAEAAAQKFNLIAVEGAGIRFRFTPHFPPPQLDAFLLCRINVVFTIELTSDPPLSVQGSLKGMEI
jgi:hypothetical protein